MSPKLELAAAARAVILCSLSLFHSVESSRCLGYKCLQRITDHNDLDSTCRGNQYLLTYCYCCGGVTDYHIYGEVCGRYCLKELNRETKRFSQPCHLAVEPDQGLQRMSASEDVFQQPDDSIQSTPNSPLPTVDADLPTTASISSTAMLATTEGSKPKNDDAIRFEENDATLLREFDFDQPFPAIPLLTPVRDIVCDNGGTILGVLGSQLRRQTTTRRPTMTMTSTTESARSTSFAPTEVDTQEPLVLRTLRYFE